MSLEQIEALADKVSAAMGEYVARGFAAMGKRVADLQAKVDRYETLEKRLAGLEESAVSVAAMRENTAAIHCFVVDEIPKQAATIDWAGERIDALWNAAFKDAPLPKDGKDAEPVDVDAIVKSVLAAIPTPKDGEPGAAGKDAAPVDYDRIGKAIEEVVADIPRPKDGADGTNGTDGKDAAPVDYLAVTKALENMVAAIHLPSDGKDGVDGTDGKDGKDGVSVSQEQVRAMMTEMVQKAVGAIHVPVDGRDGTSVEPAAVAKMVDESVTKAVAALPKPRDGVDGMTIVGDAGEPGEPGQSGRDALEIDVLDGIDEKRSYPRGTYASHKGGLIRATRSTEPITDGLVKAGWAVLVEGVSEVGVEQGDDLRTFAIDVELTSGKAFAHKFVSPVMIYRGVFKAGSQYVRGDTATWDGSLFHCQQDTKAEPGNSTDWKLATKRGSAGRDGVSVKGESGPPGKNGADLTQLGPSGAKW